MRPWLGAVWASERHHMGLERIQTVSSDKKRYFGTPINTTTSTTFSFSLTSLTWSDLQIQISLQVRSSPPRSLNEEPSTSKFSRGLSQLLMLICIGWTSRNRFCISSLWLFADAFRISMCVSILLCFPGQLSHLPCGFWR